MATINISLPDKIKVQADKLVSQGYYVSFSDLVRTALRGIITSPEKSLASYCQRNKIVYLGLFGSYARGEARKDSDIDVLIKFAKNSGVGLFDLIRIEQELSQLFHRPVEVVTKLNKHVKPYIEKDMLTLYGKE